MVMVMELIRLSWSALIAGITKSGTSTFACFISTMAPSLPTSAEVVGCDAWRWRRDRSGGVAALVATEKSAEETRMGCSLPATVMTPAQREREADDE